MRPAEPGRRLQILGFAVDVHSPASRLRRSRSAITNGRHVSGTLRQCSAQNRSAVPATIAWGKPADEEGFVLVDESPRRVRAVLPVSDTVSDTVLTVAVVVGTSEGDGADLVQRYEAEAGKESYDLRREILDESLTLSLDASADRGDDATDRGRNRKSQFQAHSPFRSLGRG